MKPDPDSFTELQAWLRTLNGGLADGESDIVPSYWNTLSLAGVHPKSVRYPQDYSGGDTLSIVCTQLDLPARQQRLLVEEWCEALPTFTAVRTLWFESRLSQELFEAACKLSALEGLWIKWSGIKRLEALSQLNSLRYFYLGQSGALESLEPLVAMNALEWLQLEGTTKAPSLEPFQRLIHLKGFGFCGGDGKPIETASLSPLSSLKALEWLHLGALRVADQSLRPLGELKDLRWLGIGNYFSVAEYAWLSTRLTTTACSRLAPFSRFHPSVFPCPKCKANYRVMTTGKGSKLLCPSCDTDQLAKHVMAFRAAAEAARLDGNSD